MTAYPPNTIPQNTAPSSGEVVTSELGQRRRSTQRHADGTETEAEIARVLKP